MAGPSFRGAPLRVRVPATSANLGPGFDAVRPCGATPGQPAVSDTAGRFVQRPALSAAMSSGLTPQYSLGSGHRPCRTKCVASKLCDVSAAHSGFWPAPAQKPGSQLMAST